MQDKGKPGWLSESMCLSRTLGLYIKAGALTEALLDERGQDLVEYALVLALVALGATASMNSLATTLGAAFTSLGTKLTSYTT